MMPSKTQTIFYSLIIQVGLQSLEVQQSCWRRDGRKSQSGLLSFPSTGATVKHVLYSCKSLFIQHCPVHTVTFSDAANGTTPPCYEPEASDCGWSSAGNSGGQCGPRGLAVPLRRCALFLNYFFYITANKSIALCGSRSKAASVSAPLFSARMLYSPVPPGAGWEVCLQRIW